jgi:hypothetical protein
MNAIATKVPCSSAGTNGAGGALITLRMVLSSSGASVASWTNEATSSGVAGNMIIPP